MTSRSAFGPLSKTATALSLLCAAHCVLTPFAVALLPLAGIRHLTGSVPEDLLLAAALAAAVLGLAWGVRAHGRWAVLGGLVVALVSFAFSRLLAEGTGERGLVAFGSLALAASLAWNHRECRHCAHHRGRGA